MKVLVACEFSGRVRNAFIKRGHDAYSCDIKPGWGKKNIDKHLQKNVLEILNENWDLMIAHPPCTYLAVSGARWFKYRQTEQLAALDFVKQLLNAPIPKIALENPISIISTKIKKPDQIIEPYLFGHGETKATCLWLKNLPLLKPTNIVDGRKNRIHYLGSIGKTERSLTYPGIARAMAEQWG